MAQEGFCIGNKEGGDHPEVRGQRSEAGGRADLRSPTSDLRNATDSRRCGEFFDSRVVFRMDALGKHRARRRSGHETLKALQEAGSLKSGVRDRKSDLRSPTSALRPPLCGRLMLNKHQAWIGAELP